MPCPPAGVKARALRARLRRGVETWKNKPVPLPYDLRASALGPPRKLFGSTGLPLNPDWSSRSEPRPSAATALARPPLLLLLAACGGQGSTPKATAPLSTSPAITAADLRTRLYAFADDSMQGRRSGTPGNVKGTDWIAAEARRIGLEPAGEDGGWFQTVPILRRELDSAAALTVEGQTFKAWTDMIPRDQGTGARPVDGARAIYAGTWGGTLITPEQAAGKLVVVTFPPKDGVPAGSVNRAQTTQRFSTAAGIVVATLDGVGPSDRIDLEDAGAQLAGGSSSGSHAAPETPTFLYGSTRFAEALMGGPLAGMQPGTEGRTVSGTVRFVDTPTEYPARNVVAILRGSDSTLRGQMVAIGAHNDHDGIFPEALDHDSLRAFNRVMRPEGANSTPGKPTAEQAARDPGDPRQPAAGAQASAGLGAERRGRRRERQRGGAGDR